MASLFELGNVFATRGAVRYCEVHNISILDLIVRHAAGDWGDLCLADRKSNDDAVSNGDRILSAYKFSVGSVWVVTEADRGTTTVLLPDEY